LARRFADAGADALIFHPRVAPDRRSRTISGRSRRRCRCRCLAMARCLRKTTANE
jgi:hypothetical protein